MKYTSENINKLEPNQIFVYGANLAGIHGAGAAKLALRWGAKMGKYGLSGQTYGIPTKDENIRTLSIDKIHTHVEDFLKVVKNRVDLEFLVTKIGTGLAGIPISDIAPMFASVHDNGLKNVILPMEFYRYF
jgi:hypothetical protein